MSTATIKPKKGTTKQWQDSKRILELNEWGVELTASGMYILRIGDGINEFIDLPKTVDTPRFEELLQKMTSLHNEVMTFKNNMTEATNAATSAATNAATATTKAAAAAKACENIVIEQNSLLDESLGIAYKLGVNNKCIYIEEV